MKIAVTGWAWRTALGHTPEDVLRRLLAGERAAGANNSFDASSYECKVAAPVPGNPKPSKQAKFLKRMALFGVEVAREAMLASGIDAAATHPRVGVFFGYGGLRAEWDDLMPALADQYPDGKDGWNRGFQLLHPFWILRHLSNNSHAIAAEELHLTGEGVTFAGANAGAQALSGAIAALRAGAIDKALVVAHDSLIEPETLVALSGLEALTTHIVEELVAPYDMRGTGCVPGEAAAAVVLERAEDAGARALVWVEAADAAGGEPGEPDVETIARALARVRVQEKCDGAEVVDGAGRGIPVLDDEERGLLGRHFGRDTPLVCTLSALGNAGGASSLLQLMSLGLQLRGGELAPIAGLESAAVARGQLTPVLALRKTTARSAVALSTGAPGLVGVVRIELPKETR